MLARRGAIEEAKKKIPKFKIANDKFLLVIIDSNRVLTLISRRN